MLEKRGENNDKILIMNKITGKQDWRWDPLKSRHNILPQVLTIFRRSPKGNNYVTKLFRYFHGLPNAGKTPNWRISAGCWTSLPADLSTNMNNTYSAIILSLQDNLLNCLWSVPSDWQLTLWALDTAFLHLQNVFCNLYSWYSGFISRWDLSVVSLIIDDGHTNCITLGCQVWLNILLLQIIRFHAWALRNVQRVIKEVKKYSVICYFWGKRECFNIY